MKLVFGFCIGCLMENFNERAMHDTRVTWLGYVTWFFCKFSSKLRQVLILRSVPSDDTAKSRGYYLN